MQSSTANSTVACSWLMIFGAQNSTKIFRKIETETTATPVLSLERKSNDNNFFWRVFVVLLIFRVYLKYRPHRTEKCKKILLPQIRGVRKRKNFDFPRSSGPGRGPEIFFFGFKNRRKREKKKMSYDVRPGRGRDLSRRMKFSNCVGAGGLWLFFFFCHPYRYCGGGVVKVSNARTRSSGAARIERQCLLFRKRKKKLNSTGGYVVQVEKFYVKFTTKFVAEIFSTLQRGLDNGVGRKYRWYYPYFRRYRYYRYSRLVCSTHRHIYRN